MTEMEQKCDWNGKEIGQERSENGAEANTQQEWNKSRRTKKQEYIARIPTTQDRTGHHHISLSPAFTQ